MLLISHRGNLQGPIPNLENKPDYIDDAIRLGYDVEIDVWLINGILFLGHDEPHYEIDQKWLQDRKEKLWIHCKNLKALTYFNTTLVNKYNYFWHQEDTATLTSYNFIWAYPGNQPITGSIAVMPELIDEDVSECVGVCSDYIQKYER
jgi:hypothetical protein